MSGYNRVILIGNLTARPELRYTPSQTAVCDIRLAVTRKAKDKEETVFVDVTAWGKTAENAAQFLDKGSPVFIEGRLTMDEWEDRETGKKRSRLRVTAENVQFLSSPKRDRENSTTQAPERKPDDLNDFGNGDSVPF